MQKQEETMPASAFDAWLPRMEERFWEQDRQVTPPRVFSCAVKHGIGGCVVL